jgi:hypothetical protein
MPADILATLDAAETACGVPVLARVLAAARMKMGESFDSSRNKWP